jgi:hypothetical protein
MKHQCSLAAIAVGFLLAATTTPVCASLLNFDFSFTGSSFDPGTVTGEIEGLTNNSTSAASAVIIDTSSSPVPFSLPFNTIGDALINTFTVTNGQITDLMYDAVSFAPMMGYFLQLNINERNNALSNDETGGEFIANMQGLSGITFVALATPTPEPSAIALLGTALAGLFLVRSRANRRDRQTRLTCAGLAHR